MPKTTGVFIGDPHFAGGTIGARIGNYTEAVSEKLTEALEIARDHPADYVCLLGDLFSHPDPRGDVRNAALHVLARGNSGVPWPFPILSLVGNHDITGHTTETLEQTAIETFNKAGVIDISESVPRYDLFQIHYQHGIEKETFRSDASIWAAHSNIVPERIMGEHITIDDFRVGPRTRLVICGHWHHGYPVVRRDDGVLFANPGSLGRPRIDDAEHEIKVAIVEYDDHDIGVRYVPLTTAKPPSAVFSQLVLERRENKDIEVDRGAGFVEKLQDLRATFLNQGDSLKLIEGAIKLANPGDDVVSESRKRIEKVRREVV